MNKEHPINVAFFRKFLPLYLIASLFLLGGATTVTAQETKSTTTVYKVINPDGSTSYSDQPQGTAATKIEIAPIRTIPAYKAFDTFDTMPKTVTTDSAYQSLSILSPENGSAFHSGSGNIMVSTKIVPALRTEDSLRFLLDGNVIKTTKSSSIQLSNISRGTHTIRVEVVTPQNETSVWNETQFTIHRPSVKTR